ncbi:hypothetical protein VE03_10267 [Pseudogymnoascus sp. 23342-1-I1]|nr:hypothetical protein VE03_10267 [Pseudogymnoascus sp. 23342-1-I1]
MSDDRNIDDLLGLGDDDFDTYEPDDAVASDNGHDDDKLDQITASQSIFESPHLNLAAASVFEGSVNQIQSRSQLSGLGYNHKGDVWMRKYIGKTGETTHTIDETRIASVYVKICGLLYETLPAVQGPTARYMTKVIYWTSNSKEVPVSDPRTWIDMEKTTDEVMIHPISRLVRRLHVPVARRVNACTMTERVDDSMIFAIPENTKVSMAATAWEKLCSLMKGPALNIYIGHRFSGKSEIMALGAMMFTMKESEMFGNDLVPSGDFS